MKPSRSVLTGLLLSAAFSASGPAQATFVSSSNPIGTNYNFSDTMSGVENFSGTVESNTFIGTTNELVNTANGVAAINAKGTSVYDLQSR